MQSGTVTRKKYRRVSYILRREEGRYNEFDHRIPAADELDGLTFACFFFKDTGQGLMR